MSEFDVASLKDLASALGEEGVKTAILSAFSCARLNADVERFLMHNALDFCARGLAATHLVYARGGGSSALVGYFALANKVLTIPENAELSGAMRKKIERFAAFDAAAQRLELPAILIAQFAKNYAFPGHAQIRGEEIMLAACEKIHDAFQIIGGKIAYLECDNSPKLVAFYERCGFSAFAQRKRDADETDEFTTDVLVQMLRYFSE